MAERLCRHQPCRCEAPPGSPFCSDVCQSEESESPDHSECPCGHEACRPADEPEPG